MKPIDGFVRDESNNGAVINTDNGALKAYKLQKNKEKDIENLKAEISEIKKLIHQLLVKTS